MNSLHTHRSLRPGLKQKRIIITVALIVLSFFAWAASFSLDEVAVGPGRVIPSSQTQLVQSVQGGRVIELLAKEGEIVEEGQLLAVLDTTKIQGESDEVEAALKDGMAQQELLRALLAEDEVFKLTGEYANDLELANRKNDLFREMRTTQNRAVDDLENELRLLKQEQVMFKKASSLGGGTKIDQLRLEQKIASIRTRLNSQKQSYKSDLQLELDDVNRTVQQAKIRLDAQQEQLKGNELRSPRRGIVQEVLVSTAGGGVLPPNGAVMEIVPIEDRLLIEARFSPRDIAFIAPQQSARIKVSAYDYSIYGDLDAVVLRVSPDSFQDEASDGAYYFAVTLESKRTYFEASTGKQFPIIPGMVTTTEILTGQRTILQYLLKPLSKAADAFKER